MAPWEIWTYDFPEEGAHPCIIFSHNSRVQHPDALRVNVILCRTLRGTLQRSLKPNEVLLDSADGLDWETICRVDALHWVRKGELFQKPGSVCAERRRLISRRIVDSFPFAF
jgi:hypothetical protein